MKRVVSYALFESEASIYRKLKGKSLLQFLKFLPLIVRAHHVLWKGWELRIHHDYEAHKEPYFASLERMNDEGLLTLVPMGKADRLCEAMLWRMAPAFEQDVDAVVCRDLDVIPGAWDRWAVDEWLASGRAVHVVHFAAAHSGIMGGTLAVRPAKFLEMIACKTFHCFAYNARKNGISLETHGDDQHWLNRMHAQLCPDMLIHELHHEVGDLPAAEIRREINPIHGTIFEPSVSRLKTISPGIGVCDEPAPALAYYDSLPLPVMRQIRECEK